jgi:hypothetical protein
MDFSIKNILVRLLMLGLFGKKGLREKRYFLGLIDKNRLEIELTVTVVR